MQFFDKLFLGLMKDPPMAPVGRNGPNSFINQGQQQGAVLMIYNLDNDTSNPDKLFNLLCLYGNVARVCLLCNGKFSCQFLDENERIKTENLRLFSLQIKFLKTKEGTAMVQMGDSVAVERCVQHLNNIPIGGSGKLQIS